MVLKSFKICERDTITRYSFFKKSVDDFNNFYNQFIKHGSTKDFFDQSVKKLKIRSLKDFIFRFSEIQNSFQTLIKTKIDGRQNQGSIRKNNHSSLTEDIKPYKYWESQYNIARLLAYTSQFPQALSIFQQIFILLTLRISYLKINGDLNSSNEAEVFLKQMQQNTLLNMISIFKLSGNSFMHRILVENFNSLIL